MIQQVRRARGKISIYGISYLDKRNPVMVAWWSVAFPGFGHYLLNQYLRGTLLTLTEVITNTLAHVNEAIVYTFCGQFAMAKSVIQIRWVYGYLVIFFFAVWDSYRSAIVQNKMCELAESENEPLQNNTIHPLEVQYLEPKSPYLAALYSFFFPGLGQLYNHRVILAFYAMLWWWIYVTLSHFYESLFYLFIGNMSQAINVLQPHWLLFMPSVLGGSIYHAFITAIDHTRLFKLEQRQHLSKRYQNSGVRIFH